MLQISEAAEAALRRIREENDVPDTAALRIDTVQTREGDAGIGFAFTDGPEDGDQMVSEKEGFLVYLAEDLAVSFGNAALDATANHEGITLELRTQAQLHNHEGAERLPTGP
jgi:Fe-S cluster assembly iron-binding protein IscA